MQQILNKLKDAVNEENLGIHKKEKKQILLLAWTRFGKFFGEFNWWRNKATTVQYPEEKIIL